MGYADLGCFGSETNPTPRIDQLAEEGRKFTSFYVASSVCSASRAALMTGRYPQGWCVWCLFPNQPGGLAPSHFTIAELLQSAGYKTLAAASGAGRRASVSTDQPGLRLLLRGSLQ